MPQDNNGVVDLMLIVESLAERGNDHSLEGLAYHLGRTQEFWRYPYLLRDWLRTDLMTRTERMVAIGAYLRGVVEAKDIVCADCGNSKTPGHTCKLCHP